MWDPEVQEKAMAMAEAGQLGFREYEPAEGDPAENEPASDADSGSEGENSGDEFEPPATRQEPFPVYDDPELAQTLNPTHQTLNPKP